MMMALMVALGAACGAPARYLTDRMIQSHHDTAFPWGTLTVHIVAALLLGVVTSATGRLSPPVGALVATGFCGALSTYSTLNFETMRLTQERAYFYATANIVLSLTAGLGAAALGWSIGTSWT